MLKFHLSLLLVLIIMTNPLSAKKYDLYFLAGQSNMEGFGYMKDLPDDLLRSTSRMMIFHGNSKFDDEVDGGLGMWSPLQPGHGTGFKSNGVMNEYSMRFGPELSFAHAMLQSTNRRIAIIKYATGGTGLTNGVGYGSWDPDYKSNDGINQYDNALTTIKAALYDQDIDGDGRNDILVPAGIIWMQGEADAHHSKQAADAYQDKLTRLMDLFRAAFHTDDLPVLIGQINRRPDQTEEPEMPYIEIVRNAQKAYTDADQCANYVTQTKDLELSDDRWHYTSEAYIKMGQAFAKEMLALQQNCKIK